MSPTAGDGAAAGASARGPAVSPAATDVLAIDTAARHRLVVVRADRAGGVVGARVGEEGAALPWLDRAVAELGLAGLGAVVVVTGPGSYTGLRAGMATGLGLAHGLGLPLHGVSSLEVVAFSAPEGESQIGALVAAGRGGAYAGRFVRSGGGLQMRGEPFRVSLDEVARGQVDLGTMPPVTLDALDLAGARRGDAVRSLALAIPGALARTPLSLAGLAASYLD